MLVLVFTGCSKSDIVLGISGVGLVAGILGFFGAIGQATLSVLGIAVSSVYFY